MEANFLYIDPGTGSMLFSIFIGLAATLVFALRTAFVKIKFILSGGRVKSVDEGRTPYVVYSDHKRYWNVFKPICDEFERRGLDLLYLTQSADDPALTAQYKNVRTEFIGEGNKGFSRLNMLKADIVLSTTPGLDVLQWKRSRDVKCYVHIPHTVDDLGDYKMFGLDHYDVLLATGQNQIDFAKKIEAARPNSVRKVYEIVGAPFMDSASERIKGLEPHKEDPKNPVVLLAPSWGEKSILNIYGKKLLDALQKTEFKIIVRPHPQSFTAEKEMIEKFMQEYSGFEWNRDNDNLAVLNRADILVTDFSGIIFDWALLFNKPLIYADAKFKTDSFDADWVEDELWRFSAAQRIGIKLKESDFEKLKEIILNSFNDKEMFSQREKVKDECWQHRGTSAAKIVDFITDKRRK